jgi:hypothetical protein
MRHQPPKPLDIHLTDLLSDSAGGIAVTGDSGTGKSTTMLGMLQNLVQQGSGATLIDPHGDLAADFEQCCAALPWRRRARCLVIRPSDLSRLVCLNPLAVPYVGGDLFSWRARVASKVSHVARILLYAWGERDFNSKPVLFKWLTRVLTTLAVSGLTLPDARHFFQIGGDIYEALAAAAPDILARTEMAELADMRPRDREDLIASTKNRLLGFLENPAVELALGRPGGWLDVPTLIKERYVTIISLERGGVLRDEDVEIYANLWLSEILDAAYNLPRAERTPHAVFLDELPRFSSSFDLLTRGLAQVRKYLVRFVCAFQGAQGFPERADDRLLHALLSQCRTTVIFRHRNPADAKFFGEFLALPAFNPRTEKHRLTQLQQYQDGHELAYLTDESENWTAARQHGGSESQGTSESRTRSTADSRSSSASDSTTTHEHQLAEAVTRARSEARGTSTSEGSSAATSRTQGTAWSSTESQGGGRTRRATLLPRLRTREIVTSVQFYTPEELSRLPARDITRLDIGEAFVYCAGSPAARVRFPLVRPPFDRTPRFAAKKLGELRQAIAALPHFAPPRTIVAERRAFEERLVAHLRDVAQRLGSEAETPPDTPDADNPLLSI